MNQTIYVLYLINFNFYRCNSFKIDVASLHIHFPQTRPLLQLIIHLVDKMLDSRVGVGVGVMGGGVDTDIAIGFGVVICWWKY